jgi:hypothetical protein
MRRGAQEFRCLRPVGCHQYAITANVRALILGVPIVARYFAVNV